MNLDVALLVSLLHQVGCAFVYPLDCRQVREINDYFQAKPIYPDAHVPQTARNAGRTTVDRSHAPDTECFCVHTDDAIRAPFLLERALELTDVAAGYLGVDPPVLYSANAFWTRPGPNPTRPDIQEFHRDYDDVRFLALFVLLTDTDKEEGAQELEGPDGVVRQIHGPAGTCFLADTSRRHRGLKPRHRERGIVWFRWGISEYPPANRWDHIEPVCREQLGDRYPVDPRLQRSVRLLVQ